MICPVCKSTGEGAPIPEEQQESYGATHFSRFIGIEYPYGHPDRYDGVSEWNCPDCGARWGQFSGKILTGDQCESRRAVYAGFGHS